MTKLSDTDPRFRDRPTEDDEPDLLDLLPEDIVNHPACFDSKRYREWEEQIATPVLRSLGWEPKNWRTTDGDSFGPLVRTVTLVRHDGVTKDYSYG